MTKVKQIDWSKLMPEQPKSRSTHGGSPALFKQIKRARKKKLKIKDKSIFREDYDNRKHLRDINYED